MAWPIVILSEITEIISGGTPKSQTKEYWGGDIKWITPADLGKLKNIYTSDTSRKISALGLQKSSAKLIPSLSIILSTRAPIGHLAINTVEMATNQGCRGLVPNQELEVKFLFYFLLKNVSLLNDLGSGTTFKELSKAALGNVGIPLPPIPEQKRIVAILDKAFADIDRARAITEQNLKNARELFDSYLQQVFSKLGGDCKVKLLSDKTMLEMIDGDRGKNYPKKSDFMDVGYCLFLSTKNVRPDGFLFEDVQFINEDRDRLLRKGKLSRNDVILTTRGTIGNLAIYDELVKYEHVNFLDIEDEVLRLKEGAQIMFVKNDLNFEKQFYNGKMGVIKSLTEKEIFVHFPEETSKGMMGKKFKNKNDAMKAKKMLDAIQLMGFDINDDNISNGELMVDAGKKNMSKYHKEIMTKFKPKVMKSETNKNDKSDDGDGLDAVQPKAVKKKFADRKDKDIDNDGDLEIVVGSSSGLDVIDIKSSAELMDNWSVYRGTINRAGVYDASVMAAEGNKDILPKSFYVSSNYPNPFNPTTNFYIDVPASGKLAVRIFDVNGRLVKELINTQVNAGRVQGQWSGKNEFDMLSPTGIYFLHVETATNYHVQKLALIK